MSFNAMLDYFVQLDHGYDNVNSRVMALFRTLDVRLIHGLEAINAGSVAIYNIFTDSVSASAVPSPFGSREMVMLHELTHWTGHPSRMGRFRIDGVKPSGPDMAHEEAVAQYGATVLMAELRLPVDALWLPDYLNHIRLSYGSWPDMDRVKDDAYRAVGYIRLMAGQALFTPLPVIEDEITQRIAA